MHKIKYTIIKIKVNNINNIKFSGEKIKLKIHWKKKELEDQLQILKAIKTTFKGKIKQPKEKTLEFYKIIKDKDDKYYLWPENWTKTTSHYHHPFTHSFIVFILNPALSYH